MVRFKKGSVLGYKERDITFSLLMNETESNNLAILLPGAGYTVQAPLLHYSTGVFINKTYDVLHINYQYNDKFYDDFSREELTNAIKHDVKTVIDKVLKNSTYHNYYLIGKSLGTIAMSSELKRDVFRHAKAIWLTPLLQRDDVFNAMLHSQHEGLCFIGDNDSCYVEDKYNQLIENTTITFKLIPNVDHALQYENNTIESINVLKTIIQDIENF